MLCGLPFEERSRPLLVNCCVLATSIASIAYIVSSSFCRCKGRRRCKFDPMIFGAPFLLCPPVCLRLQSFRWWTCGSALRACSAATLRAQQRRPQRPPQRPRNPPPRVSTEPPGMNPRSPLPLRQKRAEEEEEEEKTEALPIAGLAFGHARPPRYPRRQARPRGPPALPRAHKKRERTGRRRCRMQTESRSTPAEGARSLRPAAAVVVEAAAAGAP